MTQIYNSFFRFFIVLIILFSLGCKEKEPFPVPNVPVNTLINLNLPSYQDLNNPGGWVYINGGSRGIFVYRNFDNFIAMDRHSTWDSENTEAIVAIDSLNQFLLTDPISGSQYSVLDGTVTTGPAKWGLKRYNTSWDGLYTVQVYN